MTVVRPRWRVGGLTGRLGTVGLLALAGGLAVGRPEPVLAATPCLVALAVAVRRRAEIEVQVVLTATPDRCLEGDPVQVRATLRCAKPLGEVTVRLHPPTGVRIEGNPGQTRFLTGTSTVSWVVRPTRWGRWRLGPVQLRLRSVGLLHATTLEVKGPAVVVLPPPAPARELVVPPRLLSRVGGHAGRRAGAGVEFMGIREYAPGDVARRLNWPASVRTGRLMVNEYAVEHAADIVVLVDTTAYPGRRTLDTAVRGASGVAQAYLAAGDRVGLVTLGGRLRWLTPGIGARQHYRIVETLLGTRLDDGVIDQGVVRLPGPALPPGALVFAFSPLLDRRVLAALGELRERGHPVVVLDVLREEPPTGPEPADRLALRIWRLDRAAVRHGLREMGVAVFGWDDETGVPVERVRVAPLVRRRR